MWHAGDMIILLTESPFHSEIHLVNSLENIESRRIPAIVLMKAYEKKGSSFNVHNVNP